MGNQTRLYIRTHPREANLMVEELRERLNSEGRETFLKSLHRHVDWMPGLTPFWERNRRQLVQMIDQLGSPHLFFTLSAADLHWPDLHRIIEQQKVIATGTEPFDITTLGEKERLDRCVNNLTEYPHIVASFLQQ